MEIHICPVVLRTVMFVDGSCQEECDDRSDCPVMDFMKKEVNDGLQNCVPELA